MYNHIYRYKLTILAMFSVIGLSTLPTVAVHGKTPVKIIPVVPLPPGPIAIDKCGNYRLPDGTIINIFHKTKGKVPCGDDKTSKTAK